MEIEKLASIFEEVRIAPLRADDLLVFRANAILTLEDKVNLHGALEDATGHPRILILDGGAELAIIRPEAEPVTTAPPPPPIHRPISTPPAERPQGRAPGAIS